MIFSSLGSSLTKLLLSAILWLTAFGTAHADEKETRFYSDIEDLVEQKMMDPFHITFKSFLREESRFRDNRLVYQQWNAGFRVGILSWLSAQVYYTLRDQMYPNSPHQHKDVAGGDILFLPKLGSMRLINRESNEWHITDQFYRYRNLTQIMYITHITWLSPYVYDEFRADRDQKRLNMNDLGVGLQIAPSTLMTMQIFYDWEGNRRKLPSWQYVRYVGLSFAAHL
jgi:hypothetical protein